MNTIIKTTLSLLTMTASSYGVAHAQEMKLGQTIYVSNASMKKDAKPEVVKATISKEIASWNKANPGGSIHLFHADRGKRKGEFLFAKAGDQKTISQGSPFTGIQLSDYLNTTDSYTGYQLIGAEKFNAMRSIGILGMHYIKVKPERSKEFEKFVIDKLHPAVGELLPDMQLLYYKAVAGENAGNYITIFAIESIAARDKYWPLGAPETEILKQAFLPLNSIAVELGSYLVEGSYLEPGKGAAAYFESKEWTDFIAQGN